MFYVYNVLFTSNISVHVQITMLVSSSLQGVNPKLIYRGEFKPRRTSDYSWGGGGGVVVLYDICGKVSVQLFNELISYHINNNVGD